ncbi:ADP-ribosylglycohydrolase family protein [Microbacterium elymi]|uniref:ADP-ribosylglycohydrolase family protein n=1 Tax=Microbacterium elymi TaxID=2909587 RepID=UPI00338FAAE8
MLGSAAGDALGSRYEFGPALPDEVTPAFGRGVFGHDVGEWTDDTSMAMPILRVLADGRTLEDLAALNEIVASWCEWSRSAKDVGAQTRSILSALPVPTAAAAFAESERAHAARNAAPAMGRSCAPDQSRSATSTEPPPSSSPRPVASRS